MEEFERICGNQFVLHIIIGCLQFFTTMGRYWLVSCWLNNDYKANLSLASLPYAANEIETDLGNTFQGFYLHQR